VRDASRAARARSAPCHPPRDSRRAAERPVRRAGALSHPNISREHCYVWRERRTGQAFVRDTSKYGTLLDGRPLRKEVATPLHAGAELALLSRSLRDGESWSRHTFPPDAGFLFVLEALADGTASEQSDEEMNGSAAASFSSRPVAPELLTAADCGAVL
jgi:hypothetical protein